MAPINEQDKRRLVDTVKQRSAAAPERRRRNETRVDASSLPDVTIEVRGPSGQTQKYSVAPVDLSPSGFAFLHSSFVYPGSPITVTLRSREGEPLSLIGKVRRCEHVSGRYHEIGVKLDQRIDPLDFVTESDPAGAALAGPIPWSDIRRLSEKLTQLATEARDASAASKLVVALSMYQRALRGR
ncbi:MAG TPA: hypothetical protein VF777_00805 [Phycisphaerales bacterium]